MIAFERADDAVEWCLMLQELMMEVGPFFLRRVLCLGALMPGSDMFFPGNAAMMKVGGF